MSTHFESDTTSKPGHGDDHPFKVTVRPLAGHSDKVTIKPSHTIGEVTDKEVKLLISEGWLTAGNYSLSLPRVSDNELDPSATFGDLGIVEGDILVLVIPGDPCRRRPSAARNEACRRIGPPAPLDHPHTHVQRVPHQKHHMADDSAVDPRNGLSPGGRRCGCR